MNDIIHNLPMLAHTKHWVYFVPIRHHCLAHSDDENTPYQQNLNLSPTSFGYTHISKASKQFWTSQGSKIKERAET